MMKLTIFFLAILGLTVKPLHAIPNGAISNPPAAKEKFAAGTERGLKGRKNKESKVPKMMKEKKMMMKKKKKKKKKKNVTTADPTAAKQMACNFLSIPNLTTCLSTLAFSYSFLNRPTGSTIPSEIGLLTQMTSLRFFDVSLTSTIPSEIGLLTQLVYLDFVENALTSSIPSEIGLLTQLAYLDFSENDLTSAIPNEIDLLTQLTVLGFNDNALMGTIPSSLCSLSPIYIYIDCDEITCASGCCVSWPDATSCG